MLRLSRRSLTRATSPGSLAALLSPAADRPPSLSQHPRALRRMSCDEGGRGRGGGATATSNQAVSAGGDKEEDCPAVTAGIIIIGDEILKGQTQDTNTFFLAGHLHSFGISLRRVSVIPDDVDTIAREVREFSERYTVVLTSGGIGPTHDDVTFEGVAKAFDDVVRPHPKIVQFVRDWFKTDDPKAPALKLAEVPSRATLNFGVDKVTGKEIRYPIVSVENVYVFPGIPDLLRRSFTNLGEQLFGTLTRRRFHVRECYLRDIETDIADQLNLLVKNYSEVTFGSYPELTHNYYKTKITIEAENSEMADLVEKELRSTLTTISYDKSPRKDASEKISKLLKESDDYDFKAMLTEAINTIQKCFTDYKPEEVIVCFNGGKDCIVMLHLIYAFFSKEYPDKKLQVIYIKEKDPFPEVEKFILDTEVSYNLEALNYDGPMKDALQKMLDERPSVKATVLGTRMGDPGALHQDLFSPTDKGWPKVMRVNPVLNWEYGHVWKFIRGLSLAYPSLYDQGFTSLGNVKNTAKNEALRIVDNDGISKYLPAYELQNGEQERNGRK